MPAILLALHFRFAVRLLGVTVLALMILFGTLT